MLARVMAVEVCGFAVMSNHLHLVLGLRPVVAAARSAEEIARRWWKPFRGRRDAHESATPPSEAELATMTADPERVEVLRQRWPISRGSCTGRAKKLPDSCHISLILLYNKE